jgi:hypothetical protein
VEIKLLDHTNTGWARRILITYEITSGYDDLPESFKEKYTEGLDLYRLLDDTTSEELANV